MEILTAVLLGTFSGLVVGFLPGIGATVLMMTAMSILMTWSPAAVILFYASAIQASHFSGSVSSINFGLLGEATSDPALRERPIIVKHNLERIALKYTALGSFLACAFAVLLLQSMNQVFSSASFVLRTDFFIFITSIILASCLFWRKNSLLTNSLLIMVGLILGHVGHHSFSATEEYHFLTFGQKELFNGIPQITVLAAFLAIPALAKFNDISVLDYRAPSGSSPEITFPWYSFARGTTVGLVAGLIPMIGNLISSNFAWAVENKFKRSQDPADGLARLVSAESANNSSQITVLLPLLLMGVAIVPSEIVLLGILENSNWTHVIKEWRFWEIGLFGWLSIGVIVACVISYLVCYTFVLPISSFLRQNLRVLNWATLLVMTVSVCYLGWTVDHTVLFLALFVVMASIAYLGRHHDFIPLVAGFLLSDSIIYKLPVLYKLYFQ